MKKSVLGRGLGALIPSRDEAGPATGLAEVPIGRITPNPYQPRKAFDEAAIEELARSVKEHGVVQPLVVSRTGDHYRLIAGERRFRAARKAGLSTVPVVIKELAKESDALEIALIENIQREDLNPMEEAIAYQQLHQEFGMTQEEIAQRVGKERSTVANFLRLIRLPESVKKLLTGGQLSMGHARALLSVESAKKLEVLAGRVVRQNLNVRQTEILASGAGNAQVKKRQTLKDVFTRDAEEKLTRSLRTKVAIERKRRGGTIVVHFSNEDELIRLHEELAGHGRKR